MPQSRPPAKHVVDTARRGARLGTVRYGRAAAHADATVGASDRPRPARPRLDRPDSVRPETTRLRRYRLASMTATPARPSRKGSRPRTPPWWRLNAYSLALASVPYTDNVFAVAATKLKELTGAAVAGISTYDNTTATLTVAQTSFTEDESSTVLRLLGRRFEGMRIPVAADVYDRLTSHAVLDADTLNALSFGVIPAAVGSILEMAFDIGWFKSMAILHEGQLIGTLVLAGRRGTRPSRTRRTRRLLERDVECPAPMDVGPGLAGPCRARGQLVPCGAGRNRRARGHDGHRSERFSSARCSDGRAANSSASRCRSCSRRRPSTTVAGHDSRNNSPEPAPVRSRLSSHDAMGRWCR